MTFLRKRSRSQCSTFSSDDESTCSRNSKSNDRRNSEESSNTQMTAEDFPVDDSCVLRNAPNHTFAHLQFLSWVAFTRNFTKSPITELEKRTCPLLWCRTVFPDQEAMLQHVWACERLSDGVYWCFQCQKPERIGKFSSKKGHDGHSKTGRMTKVAKKMFSALGSRGRSADHVTLPTTCGMSKALPEITEEDEPCEEWLRKTFAESLDDKETRWEPPSMPELPNTGLCEMEAAYVSEMSTDWNYSQELPDSQVKTSQKGNDHTPSFMSTNDQYCTQLSENWDCVDEQSIRPPRSSLPRLNTLINTMSWNQDMAATIVSPLSPTGGFDFGTFNAFDISPTDTDDSLNTIFTDSGYSSATLESAWTGSNSSGSLRTNDSLRRKKRSFPDNAEAQLPELDNFDYTEFTIFPQLSSAFDDQLIVFGATTEDNTTKRPFNISRAISPHWPDTESLVESFSNVLNDNINHSRSVLQQMAPNDIITELLSLTSSSVASIGLDVLGGLLQDRKPTAVISIFAYTHVAYACAMSMDSNTTKVKTAEWFQDSLSLLENLPDKQRQTYDQIVRIIWQPRSAPPMNFTVQDSNRLLVACKQFLDIQESLTYQEVQATSGNSAPPFDTNQALFLHNAQTYVIQELIKNMVGFEEQLSQVKQRLNANLVTDVRRLELELIQAGNFSSIGEESYNQFYSHVTRLCGSLYMDPGYASRTSHHLQAIVRTKELLPKEIVQEDTSGGKHISNDMEFGFDANFPDSGYSTMDFSGGLSEEMQASLDELAKDADAILNDPSTFGSSFSSRTKLEAQPHPLPPPTTLPYTFDPQHHEKQLNQSTLHVPSTSQTPVSRRSKSGSTTPNNSNYIYDPTTNPKYRCHCGYEPTGEERWKPSNLARHKRTQHPLIEKRWKCQWQGCKSEFTRSDNLRSHQKDKGHGNMSDLGPGDSDWGPGIGGYISGSSRETQERASKKRRTVEDREPCMGL